MPLLFGTPQGLREERRVSFDDRGKYIIQRVPDGPAELAVTAITSNRKHYFRRKTFEIVDNTSNVQDIDIQPGNGVVSGTVILDKPAANGYVMLLDGDFDPATCRGKVSICRFAKGSDVSPWTILSVRRN